MKSKLPAAQKRPPLWFGPDILMGKEPKRCRNGTSQTMTDSDQSAQHLFSADRPIRSRDEDQLYRRTFAEELARAVCGWRDNDSLVIALYGPWGSGKSSIKNMVSTLYVQYRTAQRSSISIRGKSPTARSSAKRFLTKSASPLERGRLLPGRIGTKRSNTGSDTLRGLRAAGSCSLA